MVPSLATSYRKNTDTDVDAIVIGAGFGGLYALYKLRYELGLNRVQLFEKGGDIGGTWYWNRYPGALADTESLVYCYSFDKDLLQEWEFDSKFLGQKSVLKYLNLFAEKYNLRKDCQFNTTVTALTFDEEKEIWAATTDSGEVMTANFVITAMGLLSAVNLPSFKGIEKFEGLKVHTARWNIQDEALKGKRIGVIGTGPTGVQCIVDIAPKAKHLTVFQRTAQYSVPIGKNHIPKEELQDIKNNYDDTWKVVKNSINAMSFEESKISYNSVPPEERNLLFEEAWNKGGGFIFAYGAFKDIFINPEANKGAADFVRSKIAQIVKDPETAKKLTPFEPYARRPLCDSGYYETFNRENVSLVSLRETSIQEISEKGIITSDGKEHELDIIIFATGFDAVDGGYKKMEIRGRHGALIKDEWKNGPSSYIGMAVNKFPNLFLVVGPLGPFTNIPPLVQLQVDWISEAIQYIKDNNLTALEASKEGEKKWRNTCADVATKTLFGQSGSWIFGANVPEKARAVMFYLAGFKAYREALEEETRNGYKNMIKI